MQKYVLQMSIIPKSINRRIIIDGIAKYMELHGPLHVEQNRNLSIDSEYSETIIAKATNGKRVGNGNGKIDVITKNNEGIDVITLEAEY